MNLASVWNLPVVFVCENNQYAVTTSYKESSAVENIAQRATAYDMPGVTVDGQDAIAVYEATNEAVKRARSGEGPSLIEALTYRFEEHSLGLGRIRRGEYRTQKEIDNWRTRDPIDIHQSRLLEWDIATEEECARIREKSNQEVESAVEFARNSPWPEPSELHEDMWASPITTG
jgi:pyruvate dehydrogenase E1 component alpha subunit